MISTTPNSTIPVFFMCPVCGYGKLTESPYLTNHEPSFEICPSCGTEFGNDDSSSSFDELRQQWQDAGCPWWSTTVPKPEDWNPKEQLMKVNC